MRVQTLRRHDNAFGDKYEKHPGKIYEHPAPAQLIADGIVKEHKNAAKVSSRRRRGNEGGAGGNVSGGAKGGASAGGTAGASADARVGES